MGTSVTKERPLTALLQYGPVVLQNPLSREEFIALAGQFPELRMEREADGKVTVMSPVKKGSGRRESGVIFFVFLWYYQNRKGEVYSSSTGIELPDGAVKSPDCAWVSDERLAGLPEDADENFLQVMPDFLVEVRSSTDRIASLKKKMVNVWMKNGVRLAWLIDPYMEKAWIYREGQPVEELSGFEGRVLSGEEVMPGMELPLMELKR